MRGPIGPNRPSGRHDMQTRAERVASLDGFVMVTQDTVGGATQAPRTRDPWEAWLVAA
jgi:hypothetical protein